MSMSLPSSTSNNDETDVEPEQSFSSSPTTKGFRVTDEDEYSDYEFIDKHDDSIDQSSEQKNKNKMLISLL
jgi:hypothetical protein